MAKVFNGPDFLAKQTVSLTLSNGVTAKISELSDGTMKAMETLGKNEDAGIQEIRAIVATICNKKVEELKEVGIVELRGAMDFLSENLFG
jgi:hypothetical protein